MIRSWFLVLLTFCLYSAPSFATTHTSVSYDVFNFSSFTGCRDSGFSDGSITSETGCSDGQNEGSARARADYGTLGTQSSISSSVGTPNNGDYDAFAIASFSDILTFNTDNIADPTDSQGRRSISITLDLHTGPGVNNGPRFGELGSAFRTNSLTVTLGTEELEGRRLGGSLRIYEFFVNVENNRTMRLEVELTTDVRCFGCDLPYELSLDLYESATFLGIDIDGFDQSQFSVMGSNNAQYGNVVPEPNTAVLLGLGMLGLGVRARSNRSSIA